MLSSNTKPPKQQSNIKLITPLHFDENRLRVCFGLSCDTVYHKHLQPSQLPFCFLNHCFQFFNHTINAEAGYAHVDISVCDEEPRFVHIGCVREEGSGWYLKQYLTVRLSRMKNTATIYSPSSKFALQICHSRTCNPH